MFLARIETRSSVRSVVISALITMAPAVAEQTHRTDAEQRERRWFGHLLEGKVVHDKVTTITNYAYAIDSAGVTVGGPAAIACDRKYKKPRISAESTRNSG